MEIHRAVLLVIIPASRDGDILGSVGGSLLAPLLSGSGGLSKHCSAPRGPCFSVVEGDGTWESTAINEQPSG